MRKHCDILRALIIVSVFVLTTVTANAVTLYGKVTAINEGDLFTMINLNRPVSIRMAGVDAPEKGQPYADVATQHLSELILYKVVTVEYSGLAQHNQIIGRVYVNNVDIGAQMVRDGVAWFDAKGALGYSQQEKEVFVAAEKAARDEHRGIWQDESPVAPWEYDNAKTMKLSPVVASSSAPAREAPKKNDFLSTFDSYRGPSGGVEAETIGSWRTLSPEGYNFNVSVPGNAVERGVIIPTPDGKSVDANACVASNKTSFYMVAWLKAPNSGMADTDAMTNMMEGFLSGLKGRGSNLTFENEQTIKNGSVAGREYKFSREGLAGTIRLFTKYVAKERHVYLLMVATRVPNDPQSTEFLNSLKFEKK